MVAKPINNFHSKHVDKIIIFIFPIFLVFLNRNWIFNPATDFLPDAWFYLAYFRYFFTYAHAYPSNIHYFVERLTWNIPGYYIYQLLPPMLANYTLHLIVCYIALFSLYGILSLLFNHRAALLTALLLGSYPWFLRAVGWDYIDGIGIALMLMLLYILTIASRSPKWRFYPFLAGIVHASLLITNLFWLGFIPGLIAYFLFINSPIYKKTAWMLIGRAIYFMLGNLALLIVGGIFYHSVTGTYIFLKNSLAFSIQNSHNVNMINFSREVYGRMPPYWHVVPLVVALAAIWQLIKNLHGKYRYSFLATISFFVLAYAWLIFGNFFGWPYLIVFLYSSFLIPSVFLLLGALLAYVVDQFSNTQYFIIIIISVLILAAPYLLVIILPVMGNWQGNIYPILFFSLLFLVNLSLRGKKAVILPILISFSTLSFLVGINAYVFLSDPLKSQDNFTAIIDASQAIDSYFPNHSYGDFRLWFRDDKNYSTFFDLSSLYLYPWGSAIDKPASGKKHPNLLSFLNSDPLQDGDRIVIISSNPDTNQVMKEANQGLAYRNAYLILEVLKEIKEGSLQFTLYFMKIRMISNN